MISLEKNSDDWSNWSVTINNTIYKLGNVGSMYSDKTYDVWLDEGHLPLSILKEINISKLPSELILHFYAANGELGKNVEYISLCTHPEERHLSYTWEINTIEWKGYINPFIIRDAVAEYLTIHLYNGSKDKINVDNEDAIASIIFDVDFTDDNLWHVINNIKNDINNALSEVEEKLIVDEYSNKIVAKFEFDSTVQQACSSYLFYFIEFLKDMGINADGNIRTHGNRVLFTVEPKSKEESLLVISKALSIYLSTPEIDTKDIKYLNQNPDPLTELKVEKLKSEIDRLKSSLRTSEALVRYQDSLLSNTTYQEILPKSPIDGLCEVYIDNEKQEKESFLGGAIKLGVYKKAGVEIDWKLLLQYFSRK